MGAEQTHHAREFWALMAHIETGLDEYSIQTLIENNEEDLWEMQNNDSKRLQRR